MAYVPVVLKELWIHKLKLLGCFALVCGAILMVGMSWPVTYETETTIYADNQNILRPILGQKAQVTKIQDQTRVVQEVINSPRILRRVVATLHSESVLDDKLQLERLVNQIRAKLYVYRIGNSYIKIGYSDATADAAYNVLNTVVDQFLQDRSESKTSGSKDAFEFIGRQVSQYKSQLVAAENRLKEFQGDNVDGREVDVNVRINQLRASIEEQKIELQESTSRIRSLVQQLREESQFSAQQLQADGNRERLRTLQARLGDLLLVYKETYPDVKAVKAQIKNVQDSIVNSEQPVSRNAGLAGDLSVNPLYEELRSKLAEARVDQKTQQHRLAAKQKLLDEGYERSKRLAGRQAELVELTRDYDVTKGIYEDMLARKESARLSMALDVEGQGINYKIQEPASFPLSPTGLRFYHFVLLGPVLGGFLSVVMVIGYILLDPRIRLPLEIRHFSQAPMLACLPRLSSAQEVKQTGMQIALLALLFSLVMSAYIGVVLAHQSGAI